jgi:RNA polymerase sigma-70 factor (ECF subfamily)
VDLETAYLRQVIDGNVSRFSWFVDRYKDLVYSVAYRILGNEQDSEEAVQDAFLQAYKSIATFRQEARFSTWLCRIVVNQSLARLRKRKPQQRYEDIEVADEQIGTIETGYRRLLAKDQTRMIDRALEKLEPEDRLVLTLYYLDEQSVGEVAAITGIPGDNIKMRLHRARKRMYGILNRLVNTETKTF